MERLYSIFKECKTVSTDTRTIAPGSMFIALKGDNFDANTMVELALKQGAGHVVTSNSKLEGNSNITVVTDTLKTLQELASFHRSKLTIPIVGITGTNGKTTTKELISAVLSSQLKCYATKGNLNNHIGVPLSILAIDTSHQIAVIEMGANHKGEIELLSSIARPTCGVITNVGKAHLEGFGSFEGVKETKAELYNNIKSSKGKIFINADNKNLTKMLGKYDNIFTYASSGEASIIGRATGADGEFLKLEWHAKNGSTNTISTNLLGNYNLENVLAAISIGVWFNITPENINKAIAGYTPSNNRSQKLQTERNTIFLDAYNANPSSLTLAIANFASAPGDKMLILGGMKELGMHSKAEHKAILENITKLNFKKVILVGSEFEELKGQYPNYNYINNTVLLCDYLASNPISGRTILVKGSRSNQLEKTIQFL